MDSSKVQDSDDEMAVAWTKLEDNGNNDNASKTNNGTKEAYVVLRHISPTVINLLVEKIAAAPNVQLIKQVFGNTSRNSSRESSYASSETKPETCRLYIATSVPHTPQRAFASAVSQCLKELDVLEAHFS